MGLQYRRVKNLAGFSKVRSDDVGITFVRDIRAIAKRILQCIPVKLWRRILPKETFGMCYHVVTDEKLPHVRHYSCLSTAQFETDLSYLEERFRLIDYKELVRRRSAENAVCDNSIVLTFDDGFAECATVIRPILLHHRASCIFFVITDLIDNGVMFRETKASLCIDAVLRQPVEVVETIVRELGLAERLSRRAAHSEPLGFPLEMANLGGKPDPRLHSLLHWLLTVSDADEGSVEQLCGRLGVDIQEYLRKIQSVPHKRTNSPAPFRWVYNRCA